MAGLFHVADRMQTPRWMARHACLYLGIDQYFRPMDHTPAFWPNRNVTDSNDLHVAKRLSVQGQSRDPR
jgi:hypothetical protein